MQVELIEDDFEFDMEGFDDFSEFDDDDDDDDYEMAYGDGDDVERRGRKRRQARRRDRLNRRLTRLNKKTGRGTGYVKQRLQGYVKRTELQSALAKVGKDVRRNGAAIKSTARQISSNSSRISRVSRSNSKQTREISAIRKEMADAKQMSLMMALMGNGPATYTVSSSTGGENGLTSLTMDKQGDQLTTLLPLLMSSGGSSSGGGMGFDNPLMLILLMGGLK